MRDSAFDDISAAIYAIPINEKWMLVSSHDLKSAMVNRAAVDAVAKYAVGDTAASETIQDLWRHLVEVQGSSDHSPSGQDKLVIIPTRSCNMHCVYCDFGKTDNNGTTLDPLLAIRLIDDTVAKRSSELPAVLRIHFFGGEPLIARPCVEAVVHYARMVCARTGLIPWFEITTNGLFDTTVIPLIGDYMDSVVISLDGGESVHDINRRHTDGRGTYSTIAANIRQLSRFPIEVSLRTCVTSCSVDSMTAIASHFCSEFEFDVLCFEMMVPNRSSQIAGLNPPDPYRFAAGVLKAETLVASYGVNVVHGPSELCSPRDTSCPMGRGTLMLNPEGLLTACYLETKRWKSRGLDPVVGRMDLVSGPVIEQEKLDAIAGLLDSKPRCVRCFCRHTCAGGCHIEQTPPGCSIEYDDRCRATRLITAGRLLRKLDGAMAAESFIENISAMQAVANNPDDRITAWREGARMKL